MLFSRVKLIVLALVVASPGGAQIVAAQQCDEVCQSGTDCSTGCYHSSIYSTCGQHGTCYQITNSCAAICGSGQALCQEGCYTGEYPDFASSNCEMAGYSCMPPPDWHSCRVWRRCLRRPSVTRGLLLRRAL